jgi:nucleoside-diphosphate-sugar epimerase
LAEQQSGDNAAFAQIIAGISFALTAQVNLWMIVTYRSSPGGYAMPAVTPEKPTEKVLITGSSGLIGFAVVERFEHLGYEVIGFDRVGPPHPPKSADCIEVDIASDASVRDGLRALRERHGSELAAVIHLAAYYDFSGEPSELYEQVTVRGTERLLDGLQDFEVARFLFSSTMLVHKPTQPGVKINEDSPLDANWDYPNSKIETESLIRQKHGNIPYAILRIAGIYDEMCHSIPISNQIQRIFERQLTSRVYPGELSHGQAFLHLDDLIHALVLLVQNRRELPEDLVMLLAEPEALSYDELQRLIAWQIHHEEWETHEIPKAMARTGAWLQDNMPMMEEPFIKPWMIDLADEHYEVDITRARKLLGWQPQQTLRETLPEMIAELKADPKNWYEANKLTPPADLEETAVLIGKGEER